MPSTKERLSLFENVLTIQPKLYNVNSMHACVCVFLCLHSSVVYTWPLLLSTFWRGKGDDMAYHQTWSSTFQLASKPHFYLSLCPLQWWGYKRTPTHLPFYVGDVDLKSDPHVWHNSHIIHWSISLLPRILIFPKFSQRKGVFVTDISDIIARHGKAHL